MTVRRLPFRRRAQVAGIGGRELGRGGVELLRPAAEDADGAVAVAEDRARLHDLVLPDGDILAQLPLDLLDEGSRHPLRGVFALPLLHTEGEAHVDVLTVDGADAADEQRLDDAGEADGAEGEA